ncbi:hypothetical protein HMPREF7215_2546 [Pyramidobacter piscolens W5455]|uniref:Uncharacterized protein n=1 Tax=Pyramidobacter piscolens W5455 TaxID=352165 RepID=A0ABM9ZSB5_9BACT|nr:hypothetical protein HMPREF7215_2546 [Pyramidobacter piscolens W5455]
MKAKRRTSNEARFAAFYPSVLRVIHNWHFCSGKRESQLLGTSPGFLPNIFSNGWYRQNPRSKN